MLDRCNNPRSASYKDYGGRGISVHKRWQRSRTGFRNFCEDMGDRPEGMSLDRINVNGNYWPSNCRWATAATQALNKRYVIYDFSMIEEDFDWK